MASAGDAPRGQAHFKLVLLGNAGVGKSCIVLRFVRDEFSEYNETTIGAAFLTKNLFLEDCNVKCELWDTAGQERYRSLAPMYYRGAQAAVVVYDITSRESYDGAKTWVNELRRRGDPSIVICLCGNKADMRDRRKVDAEEAREYAAEGGMLFVETSAKDSSNIERLFLDVARKVPRQQQPKRHDVVPLRGPAGGAAAGGAAGGAVGGKAAGGGGCC